jgi:hypothetical protein
MNRFLLACVFVFVTLAVAPKARRLRALLDVVTITEPSRAAQLRMTVRR